MRGGARNGAGRPGGAVTKKTREVANKASAEGIMPLDYMLNLLRADASTPEQKAWAAEKAAPYCHARLAAVTVGGDKENPLSLIVGTNVPRADD